MKIIPKHIQYLISVYITGIIFFTLFRIVLLLSSYQQIQELPQIFYHLTTAFFLGFRFDSVISSYILSLPLLILTITSIISINRTIVNIIIQAYIVALYVLAFFICSADIPYFNYYYSRLTISVLNWTDNPGFMLKMVIQEWSYLKFLLVFILICLAYIFIIIRIYRFFSKTGYNAKSEAQPRWVIVSVSILAMLILFLGMRGRIAKKSPIRTGTAYFSNYSFPNQLGLNPVYTFMHSWLESRKISNRTLNLMDNRQALYNAVKFLKSESLHYASGIRFTTSIKDSQKNDIKALAPFFPRRVNPAGQPLKANIIIIIMESMSAEKLSHFGNKDIMTPTLDSLIKMSYCFNNIYTAGIHTFNGIFSTLFGYPALLKQHPMNTTTIRRFSGFSNILKEYESVYFTTHDDQFDNAGGFLLANGFKYIISQKDYPSAMVLSTLGVPDHSMFEYSIQKLNELSRSGKPFFSVFMTASDHGPYIIPPDIDFKPKNNDKQKQIVEYADWSIKRFLQLASAQDWFRNTVFAFIADHGAYSPVTTHTPVTYDMPLSYHHTPLIIYAPYIITQPRQFDCLGGQIDVFPTVMGILNFPYINNTFGIDLLREKRPYMYFSADDKIGCLDRDFFYVFRTNGIETLYKYRDSDTKNYIMQYKSAADSMKAYAFSMLQSAQWITENNKTGTIKF